MAEIKDKIITVESLKELHEYNKLTYMTKTDCVDYMIEKNMIQSTQNELSWEWECEKFNSGKVICSCHIPYQVSGVTLNGDYITLSDDSVFRPQLPFAFTEEPYIYTSLQNTQGRNHWVVGADVQMMNDSYKIAGIKLAANNMDDNPESDVCGGLLNIKVEGKWK